MAIDSGCVAGLRVDGSSDKLLSAFQIGRVDSGSGWDEDGRLE